MPLVTTSYITTDVLSSESTTFPYDAELAGHALRIVDKLKRESFSSKRRSGLLNICSGSEGGNQCKLCQHFR